MKHQLFVILTILALALALTACGNKEETNEQGTQPPKVSEQQEQITQDEAEKQPDDAAEKQPTEEKQPAEENKTQDTAKKPETSSSDQAAAKPARPTTKPTTTKPAAKPDSATKPADSKPSASTKPSTNAPQAPAQKPEKSYSISEVHQLVKRTYGEDYYADSAIPKEALSELLGISLSDVEECIAEQPMISANIDTFVAIKAASGKGEKIAAALERYQKSLTSAGACLYPSNIPKAQAGQVVREGDYVFLVMLGAAGDDMASEEEQLRFAKEQVAKGVAAIRNYFAK